MSLRTNHRLYRTNTNDQETYHGKHVNTKTFIHNRETKNVNRYVPKSLTQNQVTNRVNKKTSANKEFYFTMNNNGGLKNIFRADQLSENQKRNMMSGSLNKIFNFFNR